MNKTKIQILSNPKQSFTAPLKVILKRFCYLRTAEKEGDIETVNNTQLGKLKDWNINFRVIQ